MSTKHPLQRNGTHQTERFPRALASDFVQLDERTELNLVQFMAAYAKLLQYYNALNQPDGTWDGFFTQVEAYLLEVKPNPKAFSLETLAQRLNGSPMHSLLWAFIKLFGTSQQDLNAYTQRHLEFYYQDLLRLKPQTSSSDSVHLIAELTKGFPTTRIPQGTRFKAGKDAKGQEQIYASTQDVLINHAQVAELKTIFWDDAHHLHGASVANSADGKGQPISSTPPSWPTFGNELMPLAEIGFAISSPVLFLKEGTRVVTLQLQLSQVILLTDVQLEAGLRIRFSAEKGWLNKTAEVHQTGASLLLSVQIEANDPAIIAATSTIHQADYDTALPIMQVLLRNDTTSNQPLYPAFNGVRLEQASLKVSVQGFRDLMVQNDFGQIDASKPFHPFGASPRNGNNLYVGNPHVFNRYLRGFNIFFEWNNLPDLAAHYVNYKPYSITENTKIFEATLLSNHRWGIIRNHYSINDTQNQAIDNSTPEVEYSHPNLHIQGEGTDIQATTYDKDTPYGFLRIELQNDFASGLYPVIMIQRAIAADPAKLPNPPYVPHFKSLELRYELEDNLLETSALSSRFVHVQPFGYEIVGPENNFSLLPVYAESAQLFIGISELQPPQTLSILFQFHEGSSNPDVHPVEKLTWYYRVKNAWQAFRADEILNDSTNGLTQSGIIRFAIPTQATIQSSFPGQGLHWLKVGVPSDASQAISSKGYDRLIMLKAQALAAVFVDNQNAEAHYQQALPAESITKMEVKVDGIKSISQPFASFGGRAHENQTAFATRISERLRHKNRAWSLWDYERMVLQQFPMVYRAKCISHTQTPEFLAPRHVTIVLIPDVRNANFQNTLQPKLSVGVLTKVTDYLKTKISPFVKLNLQNPVYEEIKLMVSVSFYVDEGFYETKLNEELTQFFAPWAYRSAQAIGFGGKIVKSAIINFIDERDYVNFVTEVHVSVYRNGQLIIPDTDVVEPSAEHVILTSAVQHQIIHPAVC
ncbi:MAG: baseplate J/gp47 family protein [Spirosomataceae bacterium]